MIQIYQGAAETVRAVTFHNSSGSEFRRSVVKIAPVPTEENEFITTPPTSTN